MNDEAGFLSKLLEDPTDDTTRLVYADWLTERGDAESATKAKFLRLTVQLREPGRKREWRAKRRKQLQPLAAELPTEWLAVVSRLEVEGCRLKAAEQTAPPPSGGIRLGINIGSLFNFVCDKGWDEISPTENQTVRRCAQCAEAVHYCATLTEAREHADHGRCIAVDLGIIRRPDDLAPHRFWLGRPSAETVRQEEERWELDPVSHAREERKRQQSPPDTES